MPSPQWEHVAYAQSDSEPGTEHEIKRNRFTGLLGCSCLSYRFTRARPKTCKHINAYEQGVPEQRKTWLKTERVPVTATVGRETYSFRRAIVLGDEQIGG